ncbi:MAG: hypothetical protein CMC84_05210 [Flavobacteriaceae bacterium]|nr:hypothetical protein [Flavobacteriaceae bacterium]|tara:strand:- start:22614 stop:23249 length:636 start_codon:yes stop_codon:yes gene_type:complete
MVEINKIKFLKLLVDPKSIDLEESNAIEKIIQQYPYFNVARIIQSLGYKNHKSTKFSSSLKKCSINSLDRSVTREIIDLEKVNFSIKIEELKNQVLGDSQKDKVSFLSWLEKTKNIENNSKTNISNLINDFLESNHKLSPSLETKKNKNFSKEFKISESEYMTETLAKIYFEQEKYNKALKAYEILSLKYPEKISLFANRINKIKKLIKNK